MNVEPEVQATSQRPGRRWMTYSWLMVALLVPSLILSVLISVVLLGTADLEGSEPMSEQGFVGWVVVLLALLVGPLPAYFGVWFGLKAHRLGEGTAAIAATVVNGLAIAGLWLLTIVTTLNQL
jgi:hypothetical protein